MGVPLTESFEGDVAVKLKEIDSYDSMRSNVRVRMHHHNHQDVEQRGHYHGFLNLSAFPGKAWHALAHALEKQLIWAGTAWYGTAKRIPVRKAKRTTR
jgi:hypothetical protein